MSRAELLELEAVVEACLPDAMYQCRLETGQLMRAYSTGNMRRNNIRCTVGDSVLIEASPYSLEIGRVVKRL